MSVPMWNGAGINRAGHGLQGLTATPNWNIRGTSGTKARSSSFQVIDGANGAFGKTESDFMFAILAILIFSGAFFLAVATIAWMFAHYHEKMIAALRFEPIPQAAPVYQLRIIRRRAGSTAETAWTQGAPLPA